MKVGKTPGGTPVVAFTESEYEAYRGGEVQRGAGVSIAEFILAYEAGPNRDRAA